MGNLEFLNWEDRFPRPKNKLIKKTLKDNTGAIYISDCMIPGIGITVNFLHSLRKFEELFISLYKNQSFASVQEAKEAVDEFFDNLDDFILFQ